MKIPFIDLTSPILPQLYAWGGPIATPLVSALTIGHHIYVQFGQPEWLAIIAGIGAFFGFEACGGACVAGVTKLHSKKRHDIDFWICFLGIIAYIVSPSLIIKYGYGPLIFAVLAVFAVFAGNVYFTVDKEEKTLLKQKELDLKLIRAETKKIKTGQVSTVQMNTEHATEQCRTDVQMLLDSNSSLSAREIARQLKISPTTASIHKKLYMKGNSQ